MQFLADLDGFTIFLSVVNVLIAAVFLGLLWKSYDNRWPDENGRVLGFPLAIAAMALFFAYQAYCPDADQPHIHLSGQVIPFKTYTYQTRRARHTGILACIGACGRGVPVIEFDEGTSYLLTYRVHAQPVSVVYLARLEEANIGNGYVMRVHPVVEASNLATGEQLFYRDTARHWPRVFVLVGDALIGLVTFGICIRTTGAKPRHDDGEEDAASSAVEEDSSPGQLTDLGLGK
jgi:hypothetical protein